MLLSTVPFEIINVCWILHSKHNFYICSLNK
jgi:hypothetical protein